MSFPPCVPLCPFGSSSFSAPHQPEPHRTGLSVKPPSRPEPCLLQSPRDRHETIRHSKSPRRPPRQRLPRNRNHRSSRRRASRPRPADLRLQPQVQRRRENHESFSGNSCRKLPRRSHRNAAQQEPLSSVGQSHRTLLPPAKLRPWNPPHRSNPSQGKKEVREERAHRPLRSH